MMELNVNPAHLRSSADGVRTATDSVHSNFTALEGKLAGYKNVFAADFIGSLIAGCYQAIKEFHVGSHHDNVSGLHDHADRMHIMADNYKVGEDASDVNVNRVRDVLG